PLHPHHHFPSSISIGNRGWRAAACTAGGDKVEWAERVSPPLGVRPFDEPDDARRRVGERQVEVRAAAISATSGRDDGDSLDSDGDSLDNDGDRAAVGSPSIPANLE
ncbi:hypothetical protein Dimus_016678, partial [Dionaea muscipula]